MVVGAGVAGLVAARDLETAGARVTVLEATDVVGGRVRTHRGFEGGVHAELGADMFEDDHAALTEVLDELGLGRVRVLRGGFGLWTARGKDRGGAFGALAAALAPVGRALDRAGRAWSSPVARRLSEVSVEAWLRTLDPSDVPPAARAAARSLARGLFLSDPRRMSLLQFADELTGPEESGPAGRFFRVRGGNDALPRALAASLRGEVVRGAEVLRVERRPDGVTVFATRGTGTRRFRAAATVLALPTPPLARIEFGLARPPAQRRAIGHRSCGPGTQAGLRYNRRFWAPRGEPSAWGTDSRVGAFWDGASEQPGAPAVVCVLAGGDLSARFAGLPPSERIGAVARGLEPYGGEGARLLEGASVAWEREPFAGGGYARFLAGEDPARRGLLSRPLGRLVFAGEHTSARFQGYVNGAVESGRRAALEVRAICGRGRDGVRRR